MKGKSKRLCLFAHTTPSLVFYLSSTPCAVEPIQSAPKTRSPQKRKERERSCEEDQNLTEVESSDRSNL